MQENALSLLITAAECRSNTWIPVMSKGALLLDYVIETAAEAGCRQAVITVSANEKVLYCIST